MLTKRKEGKEEKKEIVPTSLCSLFFNISPVRC
jgi:hypothetical protein